jgi:hypothetical protein
MRGISSLAEEGLFSTELAGWLGASYFLLEYLSCRLAKQLLGSHLKNQATLGLFQKKKN